MTQALQYTLEQVAKQLSLPQSVVLRLSKHLELPKSHYNTMLKRYQVYLYNAQEVAVLEQAKALLANGCALEDIQSRLAAERDAAPIPQTGPTNDSGPTESALQAYACDDTMKEQLAEVTFKQYRASTQPPKAPLQAIVEALAENSTLHEQPKTIMPSDPAPAEITPKAPAMFVRHTGGMTSPASPPTWMSDDLRNEALALKHRLLYKSQ